MHRWFTSGARFQHWVLLLSACILLVSCGQSDSKATGWRIAQPENIPVIPQGVYEVSLKVHEDTCSPALTEVTSIPQWPPPRTTISNARSVVSMPIYLLRTGRLMSIRANVDDRGAPYSLHLHSGGAGDLTLQCSNVANTDFVAGSRFDARVTPDGEVALKVQSQWRDPEGCDVTQYGEQLREWLPREECSESYTLTYRLVEDCEAPCSPTIVHSGEVRSGYRYWSLPEDNLCVCD